MKKARIISLLLALIMLLSTFGTTAVSATTVVRQQLCDAIYEADIAVLPGGNYKNETVSALYDAIDEARLVYEDENATDEEMLEQINKLDDAVDGLEAAELDKDAFKAILNRCENLNRDDYSAESFRHLTDTYNDVAWIYHFAETQEEIDTATAKLEAAYNALVPVSEITPEQMARERFFNLMYEAEHYITATGTNYIASTFERLLNAYEAGLEVIDTDGIADEEYNALSDELEAAINGLDYPELDKDAFCAVIESCESINKEDYTKESYDNFNWVYTEVIGVFYYGDTQEELDKAQAELEKVISRLVPMEGATAAAVVTELAYKIFLALMDEAEITLMIDGTNWASETFEKLVDAYNAGLKVMDKDGITNVQYNALSDQLEAAIDGLVIYDWDTEALWQAIEYAEPLNKEDYTEESYKLLEEALSDARLVLYYGQSQEEVDAKTAEITKAVANLVKIGETAPTDATELTEATVATEAPSSADEPVETSASTAPTTKPQNVQTFILGDVDGSSKVNIKDTTAIQKHLAKLITLSEVGQLVGDVNEDDKLNIKDATEIQKFLANLLANEQIGTQLEIEVTPAETTAIPFETETLAKTITTEAVEATKASEDEIPTESTASTVDETISTTVTFATESTTLTATEITVATELSSTVAPEDMTIYFINTQNWENINIHYWNDSDTTAWPGITMDFVEVNASGQDVYKATVPANITGIVFNAGTNQPQTIDIHSLDNNLCYSPTVQSNQYWNVEICEYTPSVESVSIDFEVVSDVRVGDYGTLDTLFFLVEDENDLDYKAIIQGDVPEIDTSTLKSRQKAIIVMLTSLSSGSNTQNIDQLIVEGDTLTALRAITVPSVGTCDMNFRFVAIEVNKSDLENVTQFADAPAFSYIDL